MLDRIAATPLTNFVIGGSALILVIGVSRWGSLLSVVALAALALVIVAGVTKLMTQ